MKTSKIKIKNLLSIKELELDGKSIELLGKKGVGKSSVLDSFRAIFVNSIDRDIIIRNGETSAEILLETDTGLKISRKYKSEMSPVSNIKEFDKKVLSPETYIKTLFTPLQMDPIKFTEMSRQEKNRIILNLIEFDWDTNWINGKFGEIPSGIDYSKHILEVLGDIQDKSGNYYKERQIVNSKILHESKSIEDIASEIPANYDCNKWQNYNLDSIYDKLSKTQELNGRIDRAKIFKDSYDNKIRGYEAERTISVTNEKDKIEIEKTNLLLSIEKMKAEILASEKELKTLDSKIKDKITIADGAFETKKSKLSQDVLVADEYIGKEKADVEYIQSEINTAKEMIKHLNEYNRMIAMKTNVDLMDEQSKEFTRKIELARELPSEILKSSHIPVRGLTVEEGIPLVNGLPINNLSSGEQLDLCVDVTISKHGTLKIILLDGVERLDTAARNELYAKCKDKGVQIIATRTTDDDELTITEL